MMNNECSINMTEIAEEIFQSDKLYYSKLKENVKSDYHLKNKEKKELLKLIKIFPEDIKNLFYGRYIFEFSDETITCFYGIDDPSETLNYYKFLLTTSMKGDNDSLITEQSFKETMQMLYREEFGNHSPVLIFVKKTAKIVACLILFMVLSFTFAVTVNAEVREQVSEFIYEMFDGFALFRVETSGEKYDLNDITIDMGEDYELVYELYTNDTIWKKYLNLVGESITILITQTNQNSYLNMENSEYQSVFVDDIEYIYCVDNDLAYLNYVWSGNHIMIYGNTTLENLLKISEKIY